MANDELSRRDVLSGGGIRLSRLVELASTVPLIAILVSNFLKNRTYYEANISPAIPTEQPPAAKFCSLGNEFQASLENLCKVYRDEYYESYTTTETSIDSKGNPHTRVVTRYRWVEPNNVPDHTVVDSWKEWQDDIGEKCAYLASESLVDISKLDKIAIDQKQKSKLVQGALSTAVYGGEIVLLLGYEEILAHLSYGDYRRISLSEKVARINTDAQIDRRSICKVIAAVFAAGTAFGVGKYNEEKSEEGKGELEKEIKKLSGEVGVPNEFAFTQYFGCSSKKLLATARTYVQTAKDVLATDVENEKVREAFRNLLVVGDIYVHSLGEIFGNGVSDDLATLTKSGYITKKLEELSSQQSIRAGAGLLIEGLAVGGTMAAVLIPAEYFNERIAQKEETAKPNW